jgi:hypothetical protein
VVHHFVHPLHYVFIVTGAFFDNLFDPAAENRPAYLGQILGG